MSLTPCEYSAGTRAYLDLLKNRKTHFSWSNCGQHKSQGATVFTRHLDVLRKTPTIWSQVKLVGRSYELKLWGIGVPPLPPGQLEHTSLHESELEAYYAAEIFATDVLKQALQRELDTLDKRRAEILNCMEGL